MCKNEIFLTRVPIPTKTSPSCGCLFSKSMFVRGHRKLPSMVDNESPCARTRQHSRAMSVPRFYAALVVVAAALVVGGVHGDGAEDVGPVTLLPQGGAHLRAPPGRAVGEDEGLDKSEAFVTQAMAQSDQLMKKAHAAKEAALKAAKVASAQQRKRHEVPQSTPFGLPLAITWRPSYRHPSRVSTQPAWHPATHLPPTAPRRSKRNWRPRPSCARNCSKLSRTRTPHD